MTGIQWRLNNAATAAWPSVLTSFTQWDIVIGPGVAPSAMSNTFASNFTGGTTTVRSGPHSFNAGDFAIGGSGSTPNPWGPTLVFTTNYLYTGGDLCLEMRFSAQSGATNQPALDAVAALVPTFPWDRLVEVHSPDRATLAGLGGHIALLDPVAERRTLELGTTDSWLIGFGRRRRFLLELGRPLDDVGHLLLTEDSLGIAHSLCRPCGFPRITHCGLWILGWEGQRAEF